MGSRHALGRIGKHVEQLARAIGMDVIWVDKRNLYRHWKEVFTSSDYISIHLEENKSTFKLIDKKLISLMKPQAYFINTARASVVDEVALAVALNTGAIGGAAVDMIDDHTVLNSSINNLIISNHVAGSTIEDRMKTDEFMVGKLRKQLGVMIDDHH